MIDPVPGTYYDVLLCPTCKEETHERRTDDIGTKWYKCDKDHETAVPIKKRLNALSPREMREYYGDDDEKLDIFASFCTDKGEFKPALVAIWIKENYKFKTDRATELLYFYNGKTWLKDADPYLKEITANLLGENTRESHYNNILFHLTATTYENVVFSSKIACENRLLDVETNTLTEFNAEEMPFHAIPVTYNKDVDKNKLVNWLEFLKQVANPDDVPLLQEWFGYCLLNRYCFHKALWIHGEGRNGKGAFDRTIKGILGVSNVSTVGLERLDGTQRFVLKDLYGKLYNSSSEPISNKIFQTEIFQKLTGGDLVSAEFKGANQEVNFVNSAKMTIIGNKFPRINNPTTAFKDRMMFVKFSVHFDDNEQIQDLETLWLNDPEQKSAILNWALDGLQRLLSQTRFSVTKTQQETLIEFNRVSDSITAFQMEAGIIDKNCTTTRAEALLAYQEYCEKIGVEPRKPNQLTQGMQRLAPKVKDDWIYKPKHERAWIGFRLKKQGQQSITETAQIAQTEQHLIPAYISNSKSIEDKRGVLSVLSVLEHPTNINPAKNQLIEPYNSRTCGDCAKYHKESCEFPNGEFMKVPGDWWAGEMRCFLVPQPEMIGYEPEVFS